VAFDSLGYDLSVGIFPLRLVSLSNSIDCSILGIKLFNGDSIPEYQI
jgi:hypothetical protein